MAFAPALLAPPSPEVQDQAAVADIIDPQALGASLVLPPPPLPPAAADLPLDALAAAASAPPPAAPLSPVDAALAPALPPEGGPALSLLPPPEAVPGAAPAPMTPESVAAGNVKKTEELGAEQVANAEAKAAQDTEAAKQEAAFKAEAEARRQKLLDRQETHLQAANAEVAAARAKAESEPFHTFWETRSIGQNIATGIGLVLGGVSWNANHVNRGVDMLEKAMALDLQLQKEKHADLWRAVNEAQEGVRTLDAQQLHELSAFAANEGAKHDALASRLAAAAAMNKGKGDVTAAKKLAIEESEKANQFYQQAANAGATANHLAEVDRETKARDEAAAAARKEENRIREIRALKYKTKGGGTGGGGGGLAGKVDAAAAKLQGEIDTAIREGKPLSLGEIKSRGIAAGIPLNPTKSIKTSIKGIIDDTEKATSKGGQGAFGNEVTIKEPDATLAIRDKSGIRGFVTSKKDVAKFNAQRINYNQAIKSLEEMAKDLKGGIISGYDIAKGNRWDNAVLAIASTTTAGATDTNVAHEAGTLKDKTGLVSLRAVEEKLQDLKSRQQEFYETLTPVPSDNPEISPLARKAPPLHGGKGGGGTVKPTKLVKPTSGPYKGQTIKIDDEGNFVL